MRMQLWILQEFGVFLLEQQLGVQTIQVSNLARYTPNGESVNEAQNALHCHFHYFHFILEEFRNCEFHKYLV